MCIVFLKKYTCVPFDKSASNLHYIKQKVKKVDSTENLKLFDMCKVKKNNRFFLKSGYVTIL